MVRKVLQDTPAITALAMAKKIGLSRNYAYKLMSNVRNEEEDGILSQLIHETTQGKAKLRMQGQHDADETVNHPPHYKVGGIETIDFIEAKGLDYCLGNVVKYITRAEHKGNKKEDLLKAQWYLTRAISKISKN